MRTHAAQQGILLQGRSVHVVRDLVPPAAANVQVPVGVPDHPVLEKDQVRQVRYGQGLDLTGDDHFARSGQVRPDRRPRRDDGYGLGQVEYGRFQFEIDPRGAVAVDGQLLGSDGQVADHLDFDPVGAHGHVENVILAVQAGYGPQFGSRQAYGDPGQRIGGRRVPDETGDFPGGGRMGRARNQTDAKDEQQSNALHHFSRFAVETRPGPATPGSSPAPLRYFNPPSQGRK